MEKRFVAFLGLSLGILVSYTALMRYLAPPPPPPVAKPDSEASAEPTGPAVPAEPSASEPNETASPTAEVTEPVEQAQPPEQLQLPHTWATLGSYRPAGGAGLLITFNSQGAAIERVELTTRDAKGRLRYADLDGNHGYLGHLALTTHQPAGCKINVVGAATPAALARSSDSSVGAGLRRGDVLTRIGDISVNNPATLEAYLAKAKPGTEVSLYVERDVEGTRRNLTFTTTLDVPPVQLIQPEELQGDEITPHPLSYLVGLDANLGQSTIAVDAPRSGLWQPTVDSDGAGIAFTYQLDQATRDRIGAQGPIEIIKRFRMGLPGDLGKLPAGHLPVHLTMDLEFRNTSSEPLRLGYRLSGPNGLPLEGWWYLSKLHKKMFYGAGARDVICKTDGQGWRIFGCPQLYKQAKKHPTDRREPLFGAGEDLDDRALDYLAVDTQYFAAVLEPQASSGDEAMVFESADAFALGDVSKQPKGLLRTTNVTFELASEQFAVPAGGSYNQQFRLFMGPKDPEVLAVYALDDVIYHGWFGTISRFLGSILHFFYSIVGNYGIAIIMLTVLVRGCMFPISRKAAKNAAMMQELAPEMRKITEKYKNDMEKRAKAQQDLFRQHNYNPFGGCWLMFLQLPIFLGLYRCIAVDIELRQAPLIPGIAWCSNLAGPDQLLYWKGFMPSFLVAETGMLGPYLNVLPLITVSLFLVHQKLFTPPATDEQSRMQLQMMKYMTLFMGFLFFKVASGLCLYFIASSLWGIAERTLIPKPKVNLNKADSPPAAKKERKGVKWPKSQAPESNGAEKRAARKKRNKRR